MKRTLLSLPLVFLLCAHSPASIHQNDETDLVNKFVSKQAAQLHGEEYEEARKIVAGDLNSDGATDLAVLYTIEGQNGTNNHVQYLAVFVRIKGRLVAVTHGAVGGKSYRAVELESISKNVILLKTLTYAKEDAACCPSKKGTTRYVLANRKLKEI